MGLDSIDLGNNLVRICTQSSQVLVITFESGGGDPLPADQRKGWGQGFIDGLGHDGLFVVSKKKDWFQTPELLVFFKTLRDTGFFNQYERVITYGASMGGFAALAFSKVVEATDVISMQPRTTLKQRQARWRSIISDRMEINQRGPLADALRGVAADANLFVFYDPFFARDAKHARRIPERFPKANMLRLPFIRHAIPTYLQDAGMLKPVMASIFEGRFSKMDFYAGIRTRKTSPRYRKNLDAALAKRATRSIP